MTIESYIESLVLGGCKSKGDEVLNQNFQLDLSELLLVPESEKLLGKFLDLRQPRVPWGASALFLVWLSLLRAFLNLFRCSSFDPVILSRYENLGIVIFK